MVGTEKVYPKKKEAGQEMKLIKITMELGIEDDLVSNNKEEIANYLTNMLYGDPDFFGEFGPENIVEVRELED